LAEHIVVAIDGPAGSGKSTVAKEVARRLGILYLDSGAFYRAITLFFVKEKLDFSDQNEQILALLKNVDIQLVNRDGKAQVLLNGRDVTREIRSQEVTLNVSAISELACVREVITEKLRQISEHASVVMDGRDIGTAVFPAADLKIFMSASLEERARRRYLETKRSGQRVEMEAIRKDIARRDKHDSERAIAPLCKAGDAVELDTTDMTIDESVELIVSKCRELRSHS